MTIVGAKGSDEGLPDASLDEFIDSLVKRGAGAGITADPMEPRGSL